VTSTGWTYSDCARSFAESVAVGRVPDATIIEVVVRTLASMAKAAGASDPLDSSSEALIRFMDQARAGRIESSGAPGAYLARILHHVVVDELRGRAGPIEPDIVAEDDETNEVLERLDQSAQVSSIIRALRAAGRDDLLDLLRVWLTVADEGPAVPTVRQVAAAYGGSRSTVARMLSEIGAIGRSTALSETDLGQER